MREKMSFWKNLLKNISPNRSIMMGKSLFIPKTKGKQGLRVFCGACNRCVKDKCPKTNEDLNKCTNSSTHRYKVFTKDPKTGGERTHNIKTRNLAEAKQEADTFFKEVKEGSQKPIIYLHNADASDKPLLLMHAVSKYLAFLEDVDVPHHKKRHRGNKYLSCLNKSFTYLLDCLHANHDLKTFTIADFLDDKIVGEICFALENSKTFGKTTFNRRIKYYAAFEAWLKKFNYPFKDLFGEVKRKPIKSKKAAISENEFVLLLKQITPENGIKIVNYKRKKRENHYRPWIKNGFKIALETGGRRPGVIFLKYKDIIEKNGEPRILIMEDTKINNQFKLTGEDKKYLIIPVSKGLKELLNELEYAKYIGTDRYLLAPQIPENKRESMLSILTKAFTHYYKQLNTGEHLTLYACRRANITVEYINRDPNVKPIHHPDLKVEIDHYINERMVAEANVGFEVFPKTGLKENA